MSSTMKSNPKSKPTGLSSDALVNICSTDNSRVQGDLNFRYKMPALHSFHEGRGNGRTIIDNLFSVAKSLHTEPQFLMKYWSVELGVGGKVDSERKVGVMVGNFSNAMLTQHLQGFIETFVLCPSCTYPEVKLVSCGGKLKKDCDACGYFGTVKSDHKVVGMILKTVSKVEKERTKKPDDEELKTENKVKTKSKAKSAETGVESSSVSDTDVFVEASSWLREYLEKHGAQLQVHEVVSELRRIQLARRLSEVDKIVLWLDVSAPYPPEVLMTVMKVLAEKGVNPETILNAVIKYGNLRQVKVTFLLETLYDHDLLSEELLLSHYQQMSLNELDKKLLEEFILWMISAEEEE